MIHVSARLRARRLALAFLAAPMALAPMLATTAHAQWVVFDPSNYAQNVLTAARSLQQITNQITSLQNQAQMLARSHQVGSEGIVWIGQAAESLFVVVNSPTAPFPHVGASRGNGQRKCQTQIDQRGLQSEMTKGWGAEPPGIERAMTLCWPAVRLTGLAPLMV